ncbi:SDR family NAD(P)-dependent oxidoreductase [Rhodococcus opacus]|uniref:3-oxoacyl-[acyl-carrier-protein] reductase MabA n=1 Tax=Rhodococcus opacus TaxID=37919 RepID=A0A076EZM7_RHOOP|nr:SDR family NAD(P)-dependent oxidoreductase [Rhodococcus opacus]AII10702.1 oxidoreductase [Rhodococcus opacus]
MNDILDLKGRVGLVTGAGQGVGRQIALHLATHNARAVIVNDYHLDRAEQVAEEIRELGFTAEPIQADVTSNDDVARMVAIAHERFGGVDLLVNNAGNFGVQPIEDVFTPFWETSEDVWRTWVDVNFYGVVHCCAAVIPGMIDKSYGRIVTIISDAGRVGEPGMEIYSGAKAGAAGLTRALAKSLGRHNITVNSVAIASTATPSSSVHKRGEEWLQQAMKKYVIRRQGQPEDIANMALFLASDASSWITGQTYPVNGGYSFAV